MNGDAGMRTLADNFVDVRIVRDHQDVVLGDGYIHFEKVDADIDRVLESGDGVLGTQGARAAMAVNQEARCGLGGHNQETGGKESGHGIELGPEYIARLGFFRWLGTFGFRSEDGHLRIRSRHGFLNDHGDLGGGLDFHRRRLNRDCFGG